MELGTTELKDAILRVAKHVGAVIVESSVCPHCQAHQYHAHLWAPSLKCQSKTCGRLYESRISELPKPGEVSLQHLQKAIAIQSAAAASRSIEYPPLTSTEVAGLINDEPWLLARNTNQVVQHTLKKALALAEELAKADAAGG
jgi:hypothetical protein